MALSGTVALAGWGAVELGVFKASPVETTAAPIAEPGPTPPEPVVVSTATSVGEAAASAFIPSGSVLAKAAAPADEAPAAEPVSTATVPTPPPETGMQLASVAPSEPVDNGAKPPVVAIEPPHECVTVTCIDAYLWSLYERTPKIDTVKVPQKIKVTVKKKGKTKTVTQTVMTYVVDDFTWKDPAAAQHGGKSLMDYVIGGMDSGFRLRLYRALRAMDDAGLMPGITSGFRDDYRQSIATGNKAASDSSFHGGSRRGGYGHGLAADIVSVKGDTRMERYATSEDLWKWVDAHEKELGIGRPYLDHDPPHVGPIDGTEYIVKRALASAKRRASQTKLADKSRSDKPVQTKTADKSRGEKALQTKTADKSRPEKPGLKASKQLAARTDAGATKHASAGIATKHANAAIATKQANPAKAAKHAKPATLSKLTSLQKRLALPR